MTARASLWPIIGCISLWLCIVTAQGHSHAHVSTQTDHHAGHAGHGHSPDEEQHKLLLRLSALLKASSHSHNHHHHHGHSHDHSHSHEHASLEVARLLSPDSTPAQFTTALTRLIACAEDPHCDINTATSEHDHRHHHHDGHSHDHEHTEPQLLAGFFSFLAPSSGGGVAASTKVAAGALLFVETIVGMLVPPIISHLQGHEWWLGLLNSFAGGIFLTAGLMHLVPHCAEAQMDVDLGQWHLPSHYPLYLLLITVGYLLVFAVERVLFEGHDHGHGHGHGHSHDCHSHSHSLPSSPKVMWGNGGAEGVRRRHNNGASKAESQDLSSHHGSHGGHHHHEGAHAHGEHSTFNVWRGVPLLVGMSVHTFLECLALGLVTRHTSFMILLAAIAAHKGVSALALAAKFQKDGASLQQVFLLVGPFTLLAPTAIATGHWAGAVLPAPVQLLLNCLAAGTFLYVGASEVLAEEFEGDVRAGRKDMSKLAARLIKFTAVLAAVVCIAALGLMPHVH